MISLMYRSFIIFTILNVICLSLGSFIIKKYIKKFPRKLIPLLNVLMSMITTTIWTFSSGHINDWLFYLQIGFFYGLSSVGLHQLIKQTKEFFKIRKLKKKNKDIDHIVSMSD